MKYIDDDMDELFNKAGRQYPLKTEPKNWDAVHSALHPEQGAASATSKKNGFRRFLPLLLLLLIPAVYFVLPKEGDVTLGNKTNPANPTNPEKINSNNTVNKNGSNSSNPETLNPNKLNNNNPNSSINKNNTTIPGNVNSNIPGNKNITTKPEKLNDEKINYEKINSNNTANEINSFITTKSESRNPIILNNKNTPSSSSDRNELKHRATSRTVALTTPAYPSKDIVINKPLRQLGGETSVPYIDKKKPSGKTGFYYGVSAAPDVSKIKDQSIKGTGYSAGIVIGYQLNLRWSVEGGVLYSKKNYFTDGKYFSKKGAGIPDNINVHWLDGGCNMLEFPVLVRYDFSPKKNTFFGTVGLTSYMMKKEDYKYGADAGVGGGYYEGHREYDHSGDHLFSNLQLSAGYKFSLSPKMNMRIEPYLKTPLKKIGIGKMPITSAGLTFSLMRDFR